MARHTNEFSIAAMARVLRTSRSGFYRWREASTLAPSQRVADRQRTDQVVHAAFSRYKGRRGAPTLTYLLAESGHRLNRKTVAKSLRRQQLRAKAARKFKVTTDSNHKLPMAPNLLERDFDASDINQKWVGDITYIWTDAGWLYLAVVLDLYSRRVIGWSMGDRMTQSLVCDALDAALRKRSYQGVSGAIMHTDRGSQYCSKRYQAMLKRNRLRCSMSRRGDCWDNAVAESFFHTAKVEAVHGERFRTRSEARTAVFEFIELDYNRQRPHSANGYVSPSTYEANKKVA